MTNLHFLSSVVPRWEIITKANEPTFLKLDDRETISKPISSCSFMNSISWSPWRCFRADYRRGRTGCISRSLCRCEISNERCVGTLHHATHATIKPTSLLPLSFLKSPAQIQSSVVDNIRLAYSDFGRNPEKCACLKSHCTSMPLIRTDCWGTPPNNFPHTLPPTTSAHVLACPSSLWPTMSSNR